jgi:ABC-type amino acid transport substrate-binding protein
MLAALHIIALGIIISLALGGRLQFSLKSVSRYFLITLASLFLLVFILRAYFMVFVPESPDRDQVLSNITLMQERVSTEISHGVTSQDLSRATWSRIDAIRESNLLKVGYRPNNLPCTFLTLKDKLVGFDIEMAHMLAEDLGVALEFHSIESANVGDMLSSGQIDIAMSCIASLPDMYGQVSFSRSYLDLTLSLIVEDHLRNQYSDLEALKKHEEITIALVASHYFGNRITRVLPNARFVILNSAEEFFVGDQPVADVLVLSAEEGTAYTYRYPRYTVVKTPKLVKVPASYAKPKGDVEMMEYISKWVELKQSEGTTDELYQYWMLGGVTAKNSHAGRLSKMS